VAFPPPGAGEYDDQDHYGAFTKAEADKLGIIMAPSVSTGDDSNAKEEGIVVIGEIPQDTTTVGSKLKGLFHKKDLDS